MRKTRYNAYAAACPTRKVLDRIADKWTVLIIGLLEQRPHRFGELLRGIDGISQKMLDADATKPGVRRARRPTGKTDGSGDRRILADQRRTYAHRTSGRPSAAGRSDISKRLPLRDRELKTTKRTEGSGTRRTPPVRVAGDRLAGELLLRGRSLMAPWMSWLVLGI